MQRIYLDNAATSFPKAPGMADAVYEYMTNIGSNVGRGTYESAYSAGQVVYETRELLCELMDFDDPLNTVFTSNITHSINILLKGFLKPGDHVIVSSMEHNAVMRPLSSLSKYGVEFARVKCNWNGVLNHADLERHIKKETKLVILTHASNICGTILPIEKIGQICKKHNIYFILCFTWRVLNIINYISDIIYTIIRSSIQLRNINCDACIYFFAHFTLVTWTSILRIQTINSLCQYLCC
jgi:selenocysteine lyase/cysteine desulfurase